MNVAIVLGTRAELIKMAPVMKELIRRNISYTYIHTGQHEVEDLAKELGIRKPDVTLEKAGIKRGRFSRMVGAVFWNVGKVGKIKKALKDANAELVLVHGDTMTTATAAIAAKRAGLKVGHVEAGIRSHNIREPWPEEMSRRITDFLSDYLFAPTLASMRYLEKKYRNKKSVYTGNTNIDVLKENLGKAGKSKSREKYIFVKLHRQENIKSKKKLSRFIKLLESLPYQKIFVVPHNTMKQINHFGLFDRLAKVPKLKIVEELPYKEFLRTFSNASVILTDGGGETEEAAYLKLPCANYRDYSERREATMVGLNLYTRDIKRLEAYIKKYMEHPEEAKKLRVIECPFGDGKASKRIAKEVGKILNKKVLYLDGE